MESGSDVSKNNPKNPFRNGWCSMRKRNRKHLILIGICTTIFVILCFILLFLMLNGKSDKTTNNFQWPPPSDSPLGKYSRAAVAADNGICSEIGRNVLLKGGNAVDAAVATTICVGVFDAHSSGIGGGHFSTIYMKKQGICVTINARQTAPTGSHKNMFVNDPQASLIGGKSIAVPGEIYGLWMAYKNYGGQVSWKDLLMPTAEICRNGILVSPALAAKLEDNSKYIYAPDSQLRIFINNDTGRVYRAGEVMKRPELAQTIQDLAEARDPVQLFYNSSMTAQMLQELRENGSLITEDDMRNYVAKLSPGLQVSIGNDLEACGPPPPSSAVITMAILNILSGFNIKPDINFATADAETMTYHKFIEAMKFAYSAHSQLGDPDYVPEVMDTAKFVLSEQYGEEVRKKITPSSHPADYYGQVHASKRTHGTAHISVLDAHGNAVSLTTTINTYFGSGLRSYKYGIIWNNDMDDFSTPGQSNFFDYPPLKNNFIEPGKRPLSSMAPLIIYDKSNNNVRLVVGAAGGSRIITTTAWLAMRTLWFNETIKEAIDAPRLHNQLIPEVTYFEQRFPSALSVALQQHGQVMQPIGLVTAATGIQVTGGGQIWANSDWRKGGGYPAGY